ncbi:uncharacterized protein TNCV_4728801 [Trichonephila clavipes]|nr:uncharacterized protein TNCV_4728801 [Trichonephila clavipes]
MFPKAVLITVVSEHELEQFSTIGFKSRHLSTLLDLIKFVDVDTSDKVLRGLKAFGTEATNRDPWLIQILRQKLDTETKRLWTVKTAERDFPTLKEFLEFLNVRGSSLELMTCNDSDTKVPTKSNFIAGSDCFSILRNDRITGSKGQPIAQSTIFGWIVADASESAYACVVYAVQRDRETAKVVMLGEKRKVAALKPICIPRLELNGALLLARFFETLCNCLNDHVINIYAWTDSQVVLSWLSSPPKNWKPFVANRTSEILNIIPCKQWRYVPSKENPAEAYHLKTYPTAAYGGMDLNGYLVKKPGPSNQL